MAFIRFVLIFCFFLSTPVFSAAAQTSIAVVDVQKLLTESKAAKSIQEQLQTHKEAFLEKLSQQEKDLRESEKKLLEEKKDLSEEEFVKKAKAFEEKLIETRKMAQTRKIALDEASAKAVGQLRGELYKAVEAIAEEKGYNLVISRQNVVIGEKSIDITEEAMKKLNSSISKITLEISDK